MGLGVRLVGEVDVVGADELHVVLAGEANQLGLDAHLQLVGLVVGARHGGLMALKFNVIVVAHQLLPPAHAAVGALDVAGHEQLRQLAAQTGRADDETLVVGRYLLLVRARVHVKAFGPGL